MNICVKSIFIYRISSIFIYRILCCHLLVARTMSFRRNHYFQIKQSFENHKAVRPLGRSLSFPEVLGVQRSKLLQPLLAASPSSALLLQVRLQDASSPGTEGTAKAGRERSHSGSCHRLDRKETGPGIPGRKHEPTFKVQNLLVCGSSSALPPPNAEPRLPFSLVESLCDAKHG